MNFKPVDEMSLRHLFSSTLVTELLPMSYIGPVLNPAGGFESSPDCLVLDKRKSPFRALRCEFKFIPTGRDVFERNSKFDVAIVWSLPPSLPKQQLQSELMEQNGCAEVFVLSDYKALRELPAYEQMNFSSLNSLDDVRGVVLARDFPSVFAVFIAAKIYPRKFRMDKMVAFLSGRFGDVKKLQPKGRANVVSAFMQTNPALLKWMHGSYYRWNSDLDNAAAVGLLAEIITAHFGETLPSAEDIVSASE